MRKSTLAGEQIACALKQAELDNSTVKNFNRLLRQQCLNEHWFVSLVEARAKIEVWRQDYNKNRPLSTLE